MRLEAFGLDSNVVAGVIGAYVGLTDCGFDPKNVIQKANRVPGQTVTNLPIGVSAIEALSIRKDRGPAPEWAIIGEGTSGRISALAAILCGLSGRDTKVQVDGKSLTALQAMFVS